MLQAAGGTAAKPYEPEAWGYLWCRGTTSPYLQLSVNTFRLGGMDDGLAPLEGRRLLVIRDRSPFAFTGAEVKRLARRNSSGYWTSTPLRSATNSRVKW